MNQITDKCMTRHNALFMRTSYYLMTNNRGKTDLLLHFIQWYCRVVQFVKSCNLSKVGFLNKAL